MSDIIVTEEQILNADRLRGELIRTLQGKGVVIPNNATMEQAVAKTNKIGENNLFYSFIQGTLDELRLTDENATIIPDFFTYSIRATLKKLYMPYVTSLGCLSDSSLYSNLEHLYAPNLISSTKTEFGMVGWCNKLINVILPKLESMAGMYPKMTRMEQLKRWITPRFSGYIGSNNISVPVEIVDIKKMTASQNMQSLKILILRDTTLSTLTSASNISNIEEIYVPTSLLNSYKTATNWSAYQDKIFALEGSDYEDEDWYEDTQWYEEEMAVWQ